MKVLIDQKIYDTERSITIAINEDLCFRISIDNLDQLVVNKMLFGEGEGALIIRPSVSNEIRIS